jgi:ADP-ribose pyrophosphatase YjhB (NUDIX family)
MEDQEMEDVPVLYCPECGEKSLRQLSAKKFVCEREHCQFTVYKNVVAAVAAIIEWNDDEIIMTRRGREPGKGKLDLPGGFVDADETLEKSLEREVQEELSLQIRDLFYLGSFPNKYPYKGIEYSTIDSVFVCKPDSMDIKCEEGEIEGWEIFDPESLNLGDVAFKSVRKALERYLEFLQQTW